MKLYKFFLFIFLLISTILHAQVKIEKVLETSNLMDFNLWVKGNKDKYPELKPIYITVEQLQRGEKENNYKKQYKISYFNENGEVVKQEIAKGWIYVKVSPSFDKVLITELNHPMYPTEIKTSVMNSSGNLIFSLTNVSLMFTRCGIYLEETCDQEIASESIKLFDENGEQISVLQKLWCPYVTASKNGEYLAITAPENEKINTNNYLVLLNNKGKELWRKKYLQRSEDISGGIAPPAISDNASLVAAAKLDRVYLYNKLGEIIQEINLSYSSYPYCALSENAKFLGVVTNRPSSKQSHPKIKILLYDTETKSLVRKKETDFYSPRWIKLSQDGDYILIKVGSDKLLLYNKKLMLVKKWDLEGKEIQISCSQGEKKSFVQPVYCNANFIDDKIIMKCRRHNETTEGLKILIYKIRSE